jgi:hypothetical protein
MGIFNYNDIINFGTNTANFLNSITNEAGNLGTDVNHYFGGNAPGGTLPMVGKTPAGAQSSSQSSLNSGLTQFFVNAVAVVIGIVLIMAALKGDMIIDIAKEAIS